MFNAICCGELELPCKPFLLKDLTLEKLDRVFDRILQRTENDTRLMNEMTKFIKLSMNQLEKMRDHGLISEAEKTLGNFEVLVPGSGQSAHMHNGVNLLNLGGETDVERARNVAKALWSEEELATYVIDPQRNIDEGRPPADNERTELYKSAVREIFAGSYTGKLYRETLRRVNQMGLDLKGILKRRKEKCMRSSATSENKENENSNDRVAVAKKDRESVFTEQVEENGSQEDAASVISSCSKAKKSKRDKKKVTAV